MDTKRLEILKKSLLKKQQLFDQKLQHHIDTVKQANGQPLNDKRNGRATLAKWDRQDKALVYHKYAKSVTDKEQRKTFAETYNRIYRSLI